MKVGILATGITPDELIDVYGSYAQMFMRLFDEAGCPFEFETYDVRDDQFPASAEACDGWLITGSKFSVTEQQPWMERLKQLIRQIYANGRPLVGICFGHQIVAEALGGKVSRNPDGWGVGLHRYLWLQPPEGVEGDSFALSAMHQDQVLEKPTQAKVLAASEFCPFAALDYDGRILTLQAHPEFSLVFEDQLIRARRGTVVPDSVADQGLASLRSAGAATDSLAIARWLARFFKHTAVQVSQ